MMAMGFSKPPDSCVPSLPSFSPFEVSDPFETPKAWWLFMQSEKKFDFSVLSHIDLRSLSSLKIFPVNPFNRSLFVHIRRCISNQPCQPITAQLASSLPSLQFTHSYRKYLNMWVAFKNYSHKSSSSLRPASQSSHRTLCLQVHELQQPITTHSLTLNEAHYPVSNAHTTKNSNRKSEVKGLAKNHGLTQPDNVLSYWH